MLLGWGDPLPATHTLAHSRARCLVRLALRSSAYRAPMKEPMDVPPTRSTGTPASSNAFSTPMCEQPLQGGDPVTLWGSPKPHPQDSYPFSLTCKAGGAGPPLWDRAQGISSTPQGPWPRPCQR